MLVLTRRRNETIRCSTSDGPIDFTVTNVQGERVRIGIAAPPGVRVLRGELEPLPSVAMPASAALPPAPSISAEVQRSIEAMPAPINRAA